MFEMEQAIVEKNQVLKAVVALKECLVKAKEKKNALEMFENDSIYLQFSYKKIPCMKSKSVKITLPNSIVTETSEVCLFVKDNDKNVRDYEPTIRAYRELLQSQGISRSIEIYPLKKVKLEYNDFEAKRNLSNQFDVYLSDARITRLLPEYLGKHFVGRKKYLTQVRLDAKDLVKEFDTALRTSHCILGGRGPTCQVTVARCVQTNEEIVDNILASCQKIAETIPGGKANLRNLNIKTEDSLSIPIFVSLGSKDEIVLPKNPKVVESVEAEDVTTVVHGKVSVSSLGVVTVVNKATTKRKEAKKTAKRPAAKNGKRPAAKTGQKPAAKKLRKST